MRSRKKIRKFLVSWCNEGLETLIDLHEWKVQHSMWEKDSVWRVLKEDELVPEPKGPPLNIMIMRARVNSQRHYEIYIFETSDLSEGQVSDAFESTPQFMAEFIRKNGTKIYSDYYPDRVKIT